MRADGLVLCCWMPVCGALVPFLFGDFFCICVRRLLLLVMDVGELSSFFL